MMTYLRLDQNQINEEHDEVMLDILVREAFAARALRQAHALAECFIVGFAVCCVKRTDRIATFNADWHCEPFVMI